MEKQYKLWKNKPLKYDGINWEKKIRTSLISRLTLIIKLRIKSINRNGP